MTKNDLRRKMLARRDALPVDQRVTKSRRIQALFTGSELFRNARTLGLYSPIKSEVLTEDIFFAALAAGKRVAYPRVRGLFLDFAEVRKLDSLRPGVFGIKEPMAEKIFPLAELDTLIVPGAVFDVEGGRLGYGKGFYDRFQEKRCQKMRLVGLCFEIQLVAFLPLESHDVPMDAVVTERRLLWIRKGVY